MIGFDLFNRLLVLSSTLLFISCGDDPVIPDRSTPNEIISLDPATTYQTVSGFGGANQMWGTEFPSAADIQKAYGTAESELGLSIFRVRIASDPAEWPLIVDVAREAQSYGARILASPWSPPPGLKSNESDIGGHLLEENYQAYADHINNFLDLMSSNGVQIYAISIQNEPDIQVSYESCDWTSAQMRDFIKNFGDQFSGAVLAAPESFNFNQGYTDVILNDDDAVDNLDIVAGHIYGGGLDRYTLAESKNKELWMTEYLLNLNAGDWQNSSDETKWDESLTMLETVHESMTNHWNAYIWWYLKRYYSFLGDGVQGTTNGEILKRGYAFSHFSKFIRPGYIRIDVDDQDGTGLDISAYQGGGKTVVVIINQSNSFVSTFDVVISGASISSAESYLTDLDTNRSKESLEIEEGVVSVSMPAKSIRTLLLE